MEVLRSFPQRQHSTCRPDGEAAPLRRPLDVALEALPEVHSMRPSRRVSATDAPARQGARRGAPAWRVWTTSPRCRDAAGEESDGTTARPPTRSPTVRPRGRQRPEPDPERQRGGASYPAASTILLLRRWRFARGIAENSGRV